MRRIKILLLLLAAASTAYAGVDFKLKEAMLTNMIKTVAETKDSTEKIMLNEEFRRAFEETLRLQGAVKYPFKNLPYVYQVESPDRRLRIVSWSVPAGSEIHFYGFAMLRGSRWTSVAKIIPLTETTMQPALLRHKVLTADEWAGALYTKLLQRKDRQAKQTYYTLLGLRLANNEFGSKIIDVATVAGDTVRFGAPIFDERNHKMYRMVFEYNPLVSMKLEWNRRLKRIVFTAMLPPYGVPRNDFQYYMPGDSYDGLAWDGKCWMYEMDVRLPIDANLQGRPLPSSASTPDSKYQPQAPNN